MAGSLTVPNQIGAQPGPTIQAALFDQNWSVTSAYINVRQVTSGTLAARPVPGPTTAPDGTWYFATDVSGGTLFVSNGVAWTQVAGSVTIPPSSVPGALSQVVSLTGSMAGTYSEAGAAFVDVDAVNLKTTVTVPVGAKFLLVWAWYMLLASTITDGAGHVQILAAGSALGPYSFINNLASNPDMLPQVAMGVVPNPAAGAQTVALQFKGDGAKAINISNPAAEGASFGTGAIPRMLVAVTT